MPAAFNLQALQKQDLNPLAKHYTRNQLKVPKQVDPERSHLNAYWPVGEDGRLDGRKCAAAMEALGHYGKDGKHPDGKTIRKDARYAGTGVFTLPVELKGRGDKVVSEWVDRTLKFAGQQMPGRVAAFALHQDETTPHMHICFDVRDAAGKLAYRKMFGDRLRLKAIQAAYSKALEPLGVKPSTEEEKMERRASYTTGIHGWRAGRAIRAAQQLKKSIERKAEEAKAMLRMAQQRWAEARETEEQTQRRNEAWDASALKWEEWADEHQRKHRLPKKPPRRSGPGEP